MDTDPIEVSSPTLRGQVLNLSMDGLAIETADALKPGKTVSLKIDGEGAIVTGSVRWSRLRSVRTTEGGESEAVYHAGIALERQADEPTSDNPDPEDTDPE